MDFIKMHGLGNDFILLDARTRPIDDPGALARQLCRRRLSVGADGLLLAERSDRADMRMRIINSDGSEAEMCGNGIRCFARWLYEELLPGREEYAVETLSGVVRPRVTAENGRFTGVRVDMGAPSFLRPQIPMEGEGSPLDVPLSLCGQTLRVSAALLGVPHALVVVEDLDAIPFAQWGPALEAHPAFPRHINANFAQILDDENVRVRTYERGAGPTMACGTGSCAVVCMLAAQERLARTARVHLAAGSLLIEWTEQTVYMTGPAEEVCRGVLS